MVTHAAECCGRDPLIARRCSSFEFTRALHRTQSTVYRCPKPLNQPISSCSQAPSKTNVRFNASATALAVAVSGYDHYYVIAVRTEDTRASCSFSATRASTGVPCPTIDATLIRRMSPNWAALIRAQMSTTINHRTTAGRLHTPREPPVRTVGPPPGEPAAYD